MSLGFAGDNVRIWLESKLEKPWSGTNVAYLFTKDVLALIADQYGTLDTTLKLRLLSSLMAVKSAQLRTMQDEVQKIIALTVEDGDGWVQILGNLITTVLRPDNPEFNFAPLKTHTLTAPLLQKIQEQLKSANLSECGPAEEVYLQRPNYAPKPNSHFTVAKPSARRTVSRDLLSSSLNTRAGLTASKSGVPGLANRPSGSAALSTSGNVGYRSLGSSSGITSPGRVGSSVLGQGSARPEGHRRFVPAAAPVANDIMMVDPIALAAEEKAKKEDEKKKKDDVKAARVAKKAAADARKEGKEEDAGVLQLGKLSQSFESAKPAKKKPKLKENEPTTTSIDQSTALPPSITPPTMPSAIAPTLITASVPKPTTLANPTAGGNSNDFADAFLAAAEVAVPGEKPKPLMSGQATHQGHPPPPWAQSAHLPQTGLVAGSGIQHGQQAHSQHPQHVQHPQGQHAQHSHGQHAGLSQNLVTSASHLPIYGTGAPSSSINSGQLPFMAATGAVRPPPPAALASPPPLKSFNAAGGPPSIAPIPLTSMPGILPMKGGLASIQGGGGMVGGLASMTSPSLGVGPRAPLLGTATGIVPSPLTAAPSLNPMSHQLPPQPTLVGVRGFSGGGGPSAAPISSQPSQHGVPSLQQAPQQMGFHPSSMPGGLASFPKQGTVQPIMYGAFPVQGGLMPSLAPNFAQQQQPAPLTAAPQLLPRGPPPAPLGAPTPLSAPLNKPTLSTQPPAK